MSQPAAHFGEQSNALESRAAIGLKEIFPPASHDQSLVLNQAATNFSEFYSLDQSGIGRLNINK